MGVYLPATLAVRLVNFARVLLLTWWMLPQQFGLLSMILLAIQVLTPLCSLGLNEAITRYVPQHETRGSLRRFVGRSFLAIAGISAFSLALMIVLATPVGDFFYAYAAIKDEFRRDAPALARMSAVVTGQVVVYYYLLAVFKGLRMFRAVAWMELVQSGLFICVCLVAVATGHLSALTITALFSVSLSLPIAYFGIRFRRAVIAWHGQDGAPQDPAWLNRLLKFAVWTALAGVVWQVLMYYPAWYLNKTRGHDAVAVFSAVRQIGQFVLIGATAIVTVVMTAVTKTWESRGREAAQRQLSLALRATGLGLALLCGAAVLSKEVIIRMFRPEYAGGAAILPLHLLFFLVASHLAFLAIHFQLIEKSRHLFWPWAFGVAANVLYALWLTGPRLAELQTGAAWQWAATHCSSLFAAGFSDPQGLCSAAWCGVFAIVTALVSCLVLVRAECGRLDGGTYLIIASGGLLAMNAWVLGAGLAALLMAAWRTEWIFSRSERQQLIGTLRGVVGSAGAIRLARRAGLDG